MGQFGAITQTDKGKVLQSKVQSGALMKFTRIAAGDGQLNGASITSLNSLISEKKSLTISKLKSTTDGKAIVGTVLSNQSVVSGFYFREIGVFAQDPDVGEILYCYGNAGDLGEYIPAGGGPDVVEKTIDIFTVIGNASNITANIDASLVYETQAGAQTKANTAETNAKSYADSKFSQVSYPVTSVNSKTGAISLSSSDVGAAPLSHVGSGGTAHSAVVANGANGFMSGADKAKLDTVATNANNYVHPTGDGNSHVPVTGTTNANKVLKAGATANSAAWGIVAASEVTQDASNRFVSDTEKSTWNAKAPTTVVTTSANGLMSSSDKSKLDGIQAGAQVNTVTSVNSKTGAVTLNASDVGATSTTDFATHEAEDATLTTKGHVQLSSSTSSTSETLATTPKAVKIVKDSIAPTIEQDSYKTVKSNKDSNGIYTTVQHKRKSDGTLVRQSVLSGGTSPQYATRTVTYYASDGTTVVKTDTFTLSYDSDGDLLSEV